MKLSSTAAKMHAVMRLIRVEHSVIGIFGVIVGAIITTSVEQTFINYTQLLQGAMAAMLLIEGGFALNDYFYS